MDRIFFAAAVACPPSRLRPHRQHRLRRLAEKELERLAEERRKLDEALKEFNSYCASCAAPRTRRSSTASWTPATAPKTRQMTSREAPRPPDCSTTLDGLVDDDILRRRSRGAVSHFQCASGQSRIVRSWHSVCFLFAVEKVAPVQERLHVVAGRSLPLRIVENGRARRLTLRIDSGGRGLRITIPPGVAWREVDRFLNRHQGWLEQRLARFPSARMSARASSCRSGACRTGSCTNRERAEP